MDGEMTEEEESATLARIRGHFAAMGRPVGEEESRRRLDLLRAAERDTLYGAVREIKLSTAELWRVFRKHTPVLGRVLSATEGAVIWAAERLTRSEGRPIPATAPEPDPETLPRVRG